MSAQERKTLLDALAREEARLTELTAEREQTNQRIAKLRAQLSALGVPKTASSTPVQVTTTPRTSSEKVALFRELFRGRLDVFPARWENARKGTAGYAPACGNEWVRGICNKPRIKCGECPHQAFLPVTDQVILDHFLGRHVVGVYPLLEDETCWFLAVDFDKGSWREDVSAFVETCSMVGVSPAVERSRSGDGAHVWFFFSSPIAASVARKMGCYLITQTMARRHELPMRSYDRLFPNQDTMPRGGFGNLIALPFQDGPRQNGNSVFVDDKWEPHNDQWHYLASLPRMRPEEVESLSRDASASGQVIGMCMRESGDEYGPDNPLIPSRTQRPATAKVSEPLPKQVRAVLAELLYVEKAGLPPSLLNEIKRLAAFQNPEFYKKQAMRLSTALTPRVISCAEDLPQQVALPRGCVHDLEELLASNGVAFELQDARSEGEPLDVHFHGELTPIQDRAVRALLDDDIGLFVAPPGSGKTVVGANLIARRARDTLILVHRTQLLDQWIAQLSVFLDLPPKRIGQIGGGKRHPNGSLDVAMIQSLVRHGEVDDIVTGYGHVIVDECHHIPAVSFERVMRAVTARYVTGLTATPRRRDGHHPIIRLQLGPVRFSIDPRAEAAQRPFSHRLILRETEFKLAKDPSEVGIQEIYRQLAADEHRNNLILDDVIRSLEEGRSPLLLTERRDHLEFLAERLKGFARNLVILKGGMKSKQRRQAAELLASIPDDEERLVLATGRFIGEGFDDARLDTLFLTMPVSWKGTLVQYAGRLHRRHGAKTEVRIIDYIDREIPMLARMFEKRERGYRAMGYVRGDVVGAHRVDEHDYMVEYEDDSQEPWGNDLV